MRKTEGVKSALCTIRKEIMMFQKFRNIKKEIREDESYRSSVKKATAFFGEIFDGVARIGIHIGCFTLDVLKNILTGKEAES